ncbi:allatostatin-A receptor-like [Stegodyphus dumicola]|uniref:allatostatin-A receptor-like n=1 Tax=Stegodyphus dumicola TaxID=202533 RepID=UPI0015A811F4|nr:allatostatin-A receptor-like [Stegodyphus dumicola]
MKTQEVFDAYNSSYKVKSEGSYNFTYSIRNISEDAIYFRDPNEVLIPWKMNEYFIFIVVTYIITFVLGVSGNMTVIAAIVGDKASRNMTSVFLVSLAIADLLLLVICAPLDVAHYFVLQWDSEGTICKLAAYAESVSAFASVLNLLAVTVERFVVIVFPIRSRSLCTMSNCKKLVLAVWIVSLILALPVVATKGTLKTTFTNYEVSVTIFSCKDSHNWSGLAVAVYRFITLFALPFLLMIICYSWVIAELWISTRTMDELTNFNDNPNNICSNMSRTSSHDSISHDSHVTWNGQRVSCRGNVKSTRQQILLGIKYHKGEKDNVSRALDSARNGDMDVNEAAITFQGQRCKDVIKMLILVVILFLVCWGPRLIMEIILKCCLDVFNHGIYTTRFIFYLLPFVHSCLNPMVYCFMSSKFRHRLLHCCCRNKQPEHHPMRLKSSMLRNSNSRVGSSHTFSSYTTSPCAEINQLAL